MALADTGRELKKVGFLYLFVTTAWRVDGSKGHDGQSRFIEYHSIVQPNLQAPCEPWSRTLRTTSKVTEVRVRVAPQGGRAIGNCRERGGLLWYHECDNANACKCQWCAYATQCLYFSFHRPMSMLLLGNGQGRHSRRKPAFTLHGA